MTDDFQNKGVNPSLEKVKINHPNLLCPRLFRKCPKEIFFCRRCSLSHTVWIFIDQQRKLCLNITFLIFLKYTDITRYWASWVLHFPVGKSNSNSKTTCLKPAQQFYFRRCWHMHIILHLTVKLHDCVKF